jgi:hypothetical protein
MPEDSWCFKIVTKDYPQASKYLHMKLAHHTSSSRQEKKLLTNTIIISLNPTHSSLTSLLHHEERKCKNVHNRQQISSSGYAKYTIKASLELEL